jgi:hypothetical protein
MCQGLVERQEVGRLVETVSDCSWASEVPFQGASQAGRDTPSPELKSSDGLALWRAVRLSKSRDVEPIPPRTAGQAGSCHRGMGHRGLPGAVSRQPRERRLRTRSTISLPGPTVTRPREAS